MSIRLDISRVLNLKASHLKTFSIIIVAVFLTACSGMDHSQMMNDDSNMEGMNMEMGDMKMDGVEWADISEEDMEKLKMGVISMEELEHIHTELDLTGSFFIPTIELKVEEDAMDGWNVQIVTENFSFAPHMINQDPFPGQGHAHVHVDGKKVARIYGPWFHLKKMEPGSHTISVTLNSNDHRVFALDGKLIEGIAEVVQK